MSLRKWLAALMVVSMALGLVGTTAFAQSEADLANEAIMILTGFRIVEGDAGTGDVRPMDKITRAELMKILTVASGLSDTADLLQPYANPFSDVEPGLWYTGYVAVAKSKGWTTGYPDGTFQPSQNITYAEVIAFLARVVNLAPAAGAWPMNYISAATEAGIIPAGFDAAAQPSDEAIRGAVFVLAHNAFRKVRDESGMNLYQKVWDSTPPSISLNALGAETTAMTVTASGSVTDAVSASLNGEPLTLNADGSFSADVELAVGPNEIVVSAVDYFGNEATASAGVTRLTLPAAKIDAPATLEVEAGGSAALMAKVLDGNGAEISGADLAATVEAAELGTYDVATGNFTAGTAAGTGTLTLVSGEASATVAVTVTPAAMARIEVSPKSSSIAKGDIVTLSVKGFDAYGNEIAVSDATYTVDKANAFVNNNGQFIGSEAGVYTVTATAAGFTDTATVGIYGAVASVELKGPSTVVGNGKSKATFTATVLDEFGNVVTGLSKTGGMVVGVDSGLFSKNADIKNGVATIEVTANVHSAGLLGNVTATFTDSTGTFSATAELEVIEQVATGIVVISQDKYMAANDNQGSAMVSFAVVDQDGVEMQDGIFYDLDVAVSDETIANLATPVVTYIDSSYGVAEVSSIKDKRGTFTVTASAEGLGSASATITADIAGNPAMLSLTAAKTSMNVDALHTDSDPQYDGFLTFKLQITDSKGIPVVAHLSGKLKFSAKVDFLDENGDILFQDVDEVTFDTADPALGPDPDPVNFITANIATTTATTVTVDAGEVTWVNDSNGKVKGNTLALTFDPGAAKFIGFDRPNDATLWIGLNNPTAKVNVVAYDQYMNKTPASGIKGKITANVNGEVTVNGQTVGASGVEVTTGSDGKAAVEITTRPYFTTYQLTLAGVTTGVDPQADHNVMTIQVVAQVPTSVATKLFYVGPTDLETRSSIPAGEFIQLQVRVLDQFGTVIKDEELADYLSLSFGDGVLDLNEVNGFEDLKEELVDFEWHYDDGTFSFIGDWGRQVAKAGRQTFTVELNATATTITSSASISVRPGPAASLVVAEADDDLVTVTADKPTAFTLRVADAFGNVISSGLTTYRVVIFDYSNADNVEVRLTSDGTWVQPNPDADEDGDAFTLKGSARIYIVGGSAGAEWIEFMAWYDANGNKMIDGDEEESEISGFVHVEIE